VYTRSDRDDADPVMAGGADIGRRVAKRTDNRMLTREIVGLFQGTIVYVGPGLEPVAEGVEIEVVQQSARLELDPANCRKVSSCDSQQRLTIAQVLQHFPRCGESFRPDLLSMFLDIGTHQTAALRNPWPPVRFQNPGESQRIAQYANVGIAMRCNAVKV